MGALVPAAQSRASMDSFAALVSNGGVMVSGCRFFGYLGYRLTSNYRLDGEDQTICATGLDLRNFSIRQRIRRSVDY